MHTSIPHLPSCDSNPPSSNPPRRYRSEKLRMETRRCFVRRKSGSSGIRVANEKQENLEHRGDWQGIRGSYIALHRRVQNVSRPSERRPMEEKWSRALGLALIERRLKQCSQRDINHSKILLVTSWRVLLTVDGNTKNENARRDKDAQAVLRKN